jgi:hypothetical protein
LDVRVDASDSRSSGNRLWQAVQRVALFEHDLPLKVRLFDEVAVDQDKMAYTRACKGFGLNRAQRAAADNHNLRPGNSGLTFFADLGEENLS